VKFAYGIPTGDDFLSILKFDQRTIHSAAQQNAATLPFAVRQPRPPVPDEVEWDSLLSHRRNITNCVAVVNPAITSAFFINLR